MSPRSLDPVRDAPTGRVPGADGDRRAHLISGPTGWSLQVPWSRPRRGRWDRPAALLDQLAALDTSHALEASGAVPTGAQPALASFLTRAAARGTLVAGDLLGAVTDQVPFEVPTSMPAAPGLLEFDAVAVRQRRAAWASALTDWPSVTAVLVTRRPHLLPRILGMLAAQTYPVLDVVVVVHGSEVDPSAVDPATMDTAANRPGPPVRLLMAPSSMSLGAALNLGCDAADGHLLTKVDDDDWYGPDHVLDLVIAHRLSGAQIVGKSTTVVHLEGLDTTVRRVFGSPEAPINRVAGGTILIGADDLETVGGWADVPRAVDSALIAAVSRHRGQIYRPHDIGYVYVRAAPTNDGEAHTWSAGNGHFLTSVREQWLGLLAHPDFGTAAP
ncbi:glycosyltransferase [Kribbia dieselivorans]|uniref:glycosyltransferase n=1 Tax=Kribbia dieselivorans TaxID=331526 RepID=UPI000837C4E2|nr:glycosyltransferase family A protein [Kribbia dieselivorans]